MTEQEKKMKKYVNAVERRLNLPREVKGRVMSDFATTIQALREEGLTDDEVYARLGTPKDAARDMNEQMKDFAYQKSPWRFAGLAAAVISALGLAWYGGIQFLSLILASQSQSIGIIGGADGPTAIFVTRQTGIDWDLVIFLAVFVLGLLAYFRLSRCKKKG